MLLGAGPLHKQHYRSVSAMGCFTIAMDRNPAAAARADADVFCCNDPGDFDPDLFAGALLAAAPAAPEVD